MKKGCDFDVYALVTNNTQSHKKCRLVFGSCAMSYTGVLGGNCGFKELLNVELAPGGGKQYRSVRLRIKHSFIHYFKMIKLPAGTIIYCME